MRKKPLVRICPNNSSFLYGANSKNSIFCSRTVPTIPLVVTPRYSNHATYRNLTAYVSTYCLFPGITLYRLLTVRITSTFLVAEEKNRIDFLCNFKIYFSLLGFMFRTIIAPVTSTITHFRTATLRFRKLIATKLLTTFTSTMRFVIVEFLLLSVLVVQELWNISTLPGCICHCE